jgi:tetratricopeptide (TPR) repeat protein
MSSYHESVEERMIVPLLRRLDAELEAAPPGNHPDEELLALFALGQLDAAGRAEVVRHVSECLACRQATALILTSAAAEKDAGQRIKDKSWIYRPLSYVPRPFRLPLVGLAVAAAVLLAVGLSMSLRRPSESSAVARAETLLRRGDFAAARTLLADARRRGVSSDRLRSLEAQAERELPGPDALALVGRLSDFGYDMDGVAARDADPAGPSEQLGHAYDLLAGCGSDDDTVVLNRGHVLLALGRPGPALAEFETVTARSPRQPLAWLGAGLAHFLLNDPAGAERDFRACLDLDAGNVAARINLAMTLEERGAAEAALAEWQRLLDGPLTAADRARIERVVAELRK